ncbi:hypothetical protein ig2599ANME_1360 [groundwater metagenome]
MPACDLLGDLSHLIMKLFLTRKIDKTDGLIRRRPRDPEKVKIFCEMAAEAVEEGVIFDENNRIVRILPWEDD